MYRHPAVLVTAQPVLDAAPSVVQLVPLTSTIRGFGSEVHLEPDERNGLEKPSAAQCQHIRAVSAERIEHVRGNVGPAAVAEIRDVFGLLLDIPPSP